ncbi:MAG: hypothetical protein PUP92_34010 [Rhizonema sp. PD38]|nr:hypothetical protein [Rhizonema sp. PD38]
MNRNGGWKFCVGRVLPTSTLLSTFFPYRANPEVIALVLKRLSDCGHVPEALRIGHLITAAVVKGESGRQAYRT